MTYFTSTIFSTMREELGTLGTIQQHMGARGITDSTEAIELLWSLNDRWSLRDLEQDRDDYNVYMIIEGLINGYLDAKAVREEMVVD